jgi:hypothetical protein
VFASGPSWLETYAHLMDEGVGEALELTVPDRVAA